MIPSSQRVVRLMKRPIGMVNPGADLVVSSAPVVSSGDLGAGQFLVKNLWLSLDPAMRGWMNDAKSYIEPVKLNDVMRGGTIAQVVASKNSAYSVGDLVTGMFGWQEYTHVESPKEAGAQVVPTLPGVSPSAFLGVLGMTGMTAYFGLLDVLKPKETDTILVSGAAGATGSVVCQIAKNVIGCKRVVGIAGGKAKCDWLVSEGIVHAAVDYKNTDNLYSDVRKELGGRIDCYFDNVGGEQLDIALALLNQNARVAICGAISQYNSKTGPVGPKNYLNLLVTRSRMEGFLVFDYVRRFSEGAMDIAGWMSEGKIKHKEHIIDDDGISAAPEALLALFEGGNFGKLVVKLGDPIPTPKL